MSKASTGFAFVAGLTIGAAGAWYYLKDKYGVRYYYRYCDDGLVLGKPKA